MNSIGKRIPMVTAESSHEEKESVLAITKVKLNLSSCFLLANMTIVKRKYSENQMHVLYFRINNYLNPRGTNFSPR